MNEKEEFIANIKQMSVEEIIKYQSIAAKANRTVNIFGVSILFLILLYPSIGLIFAGSIFIFLFANISVGISQLLKEINKILESKKR